MNIQLAFGRQQELLERRFRGERIIEPRPSAEMLVLSGDIRNGTKAVASFADWPVPIVYVAGNYEFYENVWAQIRADLRKACAETNIHFLGNDFFAFGRVRIRDFTQSASMSTVAQRLNKLLIFLSFESVI